MLPFPLDTVLFIIYATVFLLGSLFGSFFNVCIYRIPRRHFRLTADNARAMRRNQPPDGGNSTLKRLLRPVWRVLHLLGLHPDQSPPPIPPEVAERLEPLHDQDYVTINDFADALDARLEPDDLDRYGDTVLRYTEEHPESIAFPGSHCPACRTPIQPWDNIPILSFLLLRGRCRHCGAGIAWRYPMVELLTALVFVGVVAQFAISPQAFAYLIFTSLLIVISGIDIDHQLIPDVLTVPGIVLGLAAVTLTPIRWQDSLLGVLVGGGLIWGTGFAGSLVFRKEAMGGGDVKLMAMIGAFLGWKMALVTVFCASLAGAVAGLLLKAITGKSYIPFGPFLALGALIALLFGPRMLLWYMGTWNPALMP